MPFHLVAYGPMKKDETDAASHELSQRAFSSLAIAKGVAVKIADQAIENLLEEHGIEAGSGSYSDENFVYTTSVVWVDPETLDDMMILVVIADAESKAIVREGKLP